MERRKQQHYRTPPSPSRILPVFFFPCYRQESARIIVLALILLPVKIKFFRQELVEEDVSVMHC